ncbi:MAG: hypothetical protein KGH61_03270 [Candidatus Micrarchaeota archaeon]|nr:hypothetical protein [Candidatus Micrarchaeota archaeon]MDE1847944.1 hypothetical protein [Candidatus Micrarchaeota archaeon]MDE1864339.1 hypothetical protein [Candidatus Micrarchaeota archaeon]
MFLQVSVEVLLSMSVVLAVVLFAAVMMHSMQHYSDSYKSALSNYSCESESYLQGLYRTCSLCIIWESGGSAC